MNQHIQKVANLQEMNRALQQQNEILHQQIKKLETESDSYMIRMYKRRNGRLRAKIKELELIIDMNEQEQDGKKYILQNRKTMKFLQCYKGNKPIWTDSFALAGLYSKIQIKRLEDRLMSQSQTVKIILSPPNTTS